MSASSRLGAIALMRLRPRCSPVDGWRMPDADAFPTGAELVSAYLEPLAATPELTAVIETNARVTAISRHGLDKVVSPGRENRPFVLMVRMGGSVRRDLARAVVDASGTWATPNPLGASGLPAVGEAEFSDRIAYGIPDILGRDRHLYAGRKTLVVGSGHSAANALLELAQLTKDEASASLVWATRSVDLARIYSGGDADQLPARGELGANVRELVDQGRVELTTGFAILALKRGAGRDCRQGRDGQRIAMDRAGRSDHRRHRTTSRPVADARVASRSRPLA